MDERYIENLATNFCQAIDLVPGAEVCDVGSGKGYLVRKLLARGAGSVTAVDYRYRIWSAWSDNRASRQSWLTPRRCLSPNISMSFSLPTCWNILNVGSFLYSWTVRCVRRAPLRARPVSGNPAFLFAPALLPLPVRAFAHL